MIKVNIAIDNNYYNILRLFGTMDEVVDKALKLVEQGEIDFDRCPQIPTTKNCRHIVVAISNPYYEELRALHGATSSKISINRLLYYIVDNELYYTYGWERNFELSKDQKRQVESWKCDIMYRISKLSKLLVSHEQQVSLQKAFDIIKELSGNYERERP